MQSITYQTYPAFPPEPMLSSLLNLLTTVFANQSRDEWLTDLTGKINAHATFQALLALEGERVVGCKLGYEYKADRTRPGVFYSWLGGVDPTYRGRGIAGELMRQQHDTGRAAGYTTIRTHTYNHWRDMLMLNLRHGFDIVGTQPGKRGLMIVLEKPLN